jgi:hypothetical protein
MHERKNINKKKELREENICDTNNIIVSMLFTGKY